MSSKIRKSVSQSLVRRVVGPSSGSSWQCSGPPREQRGPGEKLSRSVQNNKLFIVGVVNQLVSLHVSKY